MRHRQAVVVWDPDASPESLAGKSTGAVAVHHWSELAGLAESTGPSAAEVEAQAATQKPNECCA